MENNTVPSQNASTSNVIAPNPSAAPDGVGADASLTEKMKESTDTHIKIFKYFIILAVSILSILYIFYILYNLFYKNNNDNDNCPLDCNKYINGDININGKICKVPLINGVKCPTNCVYEKEDNKYVKYSECNCDLDIPIKTPKILVESQGNNVKKCPTNINCNDCKLILKLVDNLPMNPIKTDLILNFEPLHKSIYLTKLFFKLHAYSNNIDNLKGATVQIQILNIDNKSMLQQQQIYLSNDERDKEIIFNINMSQSILINSGSTIKLIISNPNKDNIYIDYLSQLMLEYKQNL
jgi:hypothetical protein